MPVFIRKKAAAAATNGAFYIHKYPGIIIALAPNFIVPQVTQNDNMMTTATTIMGGLFYRSPRWRIRLFSSLV